MARSGSVQGEGFRNEAARGVCDLLRPSPSRRAGQARVPASPAPRKKKRTECKWASAKDYNSGATAQLAMLPSFSTSFGGALFALAPCLAAGFGAACTNPSQSLNRDTQDGYIFYLFYLFTFIFICLFIYLFMYL